MTKSNAHKSDTEKIERFEQLLRNALILCDQGKPFAKEAFDAACQVCDCPNKEGLIDAGELWLRRGKYHQAIDCFTIAQANAYLGNLIKSLHVEHPLDCLHAWNGIDDEFPAFNDPAIHALVQKALDAVMLNTRGLNSDDIKTIGVAWSTIIRDEDTYLPFVASLREKGEYRIADVVASLK